MPFVVVIAIAAAAIALYLHTKKDLLRRSARCDSAWETLNDQLERRNALVPRIAAGVSLESEKQQESLSYLMRMQAAVATATTPEARMSSSAELTSVLNTIITSLELTPQLKEELEDVDTKITYARATYNECVHDYNEALSNFPGKLVARSGFQARPSFDAVGDTARLQL